jgi:hypothetical protein
MAYYIFLKSLRSLEEFRKNPHVKIALNLLLHISKALINSKIQFLIQKSFFLAFGPANLAARSASGPASPPAAPSPRAEIIPASPSSLRVGRVFVENTFSLSVHAFPSRSPLPRLSDNRVPLVRCVFPTTPVDPSRFLPTPPATPRRPTSDLVMPGKTITPCLDSPP